MPTYCCTWPEASVLTAAAPVFDETPAPPRQDGEAEITAAVIEARKGRTDISESLLREKLRNKGISVSDLHKHLERMVRSGTLFSRGGGNYSLKKKS